MSLSLGFGLAQWNPGYVFVYGGSGSSIPLGAANIVHDG